MNKIVMPFEEASKHIEEADVLLFEARGIIGKAIISLTGGKHSHVALAHWDRDQLYCVEQKEFKGGRSVALAQVVKEKPHRIDVYRVNKYIYVPEVVKNNGTFTVSWEKKVFGEKEANSVVDIGLSLTGSSYGWQNIWEILKCYAPFYRLLRKHKGDEEIVRAFVCSTLVTYSYRKVYVDLCPNLSDTRTTPADIAQSGLLHYMFTIGE